jgi:hypothetical protein
MRGRARALPHRGAPRRRRAVCLLSQRRRAPIWRRQRIRRTRVERARPVAGTQECRTQERKRSQRNATGRRDEQHAPEPLAKEAPMTRTFGLTLAAVTTLVGIFAMFAHSRHARGGEPVQCVAPEQTGASADEAQANLEPDASGWRTAQLTTFTSYPACCPNSPVYDPNAPTDECDDYSGCKYMGEFAAIGKKSFSYVKSHDLVAFYDDSDRSGKNFMKNYGGKTIRLKKNGKTFDALIADTCGNNDCNGCCTKNSKKGFLVDMEYWTTIREIGGPDNADGTIQFQILN